MMRQELNQIGFNLNSDHSTSELVRLPSHDSSETNG